MNELVKQKCSTLATNKSRLIERKIQQLKIKLSGRVSPCHYGLNQGPDILMIGNYRTGLLWRLMQDCSYVAKGLQRAGFGRGWL